MLLPVQRQFVCALIQSADLLAVLITRAEEEEQAERDRWQGLSSVDKVCNALGASGIIIVTLVLLAS